MSATVDATRDRHDDGRTRPLTRDGASNHQISQLPYLPGLDGIRAVAVVAVMVYHANSNWLAGGYLGVEVFFVISGYLITLLLIAEHERSGRIDLKNFWIRRFRRLLPALFVMMLLLSVWVALFEREALGKLRGDVIAGALYGSNFYQIFIGAGYSAGNDFAPLRHIWSLAVEEQFYVVWPLVMMAFIRVGSRRIAGVARWLFLAAVAVTVVLALLNHTGPQQTPSITPEAYWFIGDRAISKPDALYLSTFTRAGGLLLGSAFAMVWRPTAVMRGPLRRRGAMFDLLAVIGFVVLGAMAWRVGFEPNQGVHAFLFSGGLFVCGLATLAVIAAVTHQRALMGRLLSVSLLVWVGKRSYGLYLYHWPIYQIIRNTAATKMVFHEFVLAIVATCIITELSYRFVETPIREGRFSELWQQRDRRRSMSDGRRKAVFGAAVLASAMSVFAVGSMATAELNQNEVQQTIDEGGEFACDIVRDLDCDGVLDFDADGNPITPEGETTANDEPAGPNFEAGESSSEEAAGTAEVPGSVDEPDGDGVVPGSTTPPTTEPLPPPSERLALGDSVMRGASKQLNELGFAVDAQESRQWKDGVAIAQALAAQDRLPTTMVIHLGTNGLIGQEGMDDMMAAVSDVPTVVLVMVEIPTFPDVQEANNALMIAAGGANDNVTTLYWGGDGLAAACPGDCYTSDGIHLKAAGREYYAAIMSDVLGL